MKLLKIFDKRENKKGHRPIIYRDAVRGIILKGSKILLVYSEVNDEFKFPGGGATEGEMKKETLKREVMEELGRQVSSVNESLGYTDEIYNDIYDNKKYFYLRSYYYFCEIYEGDFEQQLDNYEQELNFVPKWVTLEEAIEKNQAYLNKGSDYHWTERELFVLKLLKEMRP